MLRFLIPTCIAVAATVATAPASAQAVGAGGNKPTPIEATAPAAKPGSLRTITWTDLVPPNWDPYAEFRGVNMATMRDGDPRANAMLQKLREVWNNAPVNAALAGQQVRIPGYVVPLEDSKDGMTEFLLVPYFGACIHTPPPPANQIIFVVAPKGVKFRAMETVWVSGTLHTTRQASYMGASGYRLDAASVDRYSPP